MAAYFLDSSAAAKLYVRESGTAWLISLTDPVPRNEFVIARTTIVEVGAAFFRRARVGTLALVDAASAAVELQRDVERTYRVVELSASLTDLALGVAEKHGLRGYDCVQLAAALLTQRQRAGVGLTPLSLVSADLELNNAALAERLLVENPNDYPA